MLLYMLPEIQQIGVSALAFSRDHSASLLAVAGMDEQHTITVVSWRTDSVLCKVYGGTSPLLGLCFLESHAVAGVKNTAEVAKAAVVPLSMALVVYGTKEIRLLSDVNSRSPSVERPVLGDLAVEGAAYLCCDVFGGHYVVG
jgi:hypothetical protein